MTRTDSALGPKWTRVTGGLYVRADNAQIWADTYQPTYGARPASSGGLGTDGRPVREAHFYTLASALAWIALNDAADTYHRRKDGRRMTRYARIYRVRERAEALRLAEMARQHSPYRDHRVRKVDGAYNVMQSADRRSPTFWNIGAGEPMR